MLAILYGQLSMLLANHAEGLTTFNALDVYLVLWDMKQIKFWK